MKRSRVQRNLLLLTGLCIVGIVCSAYMFLSADREYTQGDTAYDQIRAYNKTPKQMSAPASLPASGQEEAVNGGEPAEGAVDFAALSDLNPDTVAWLKSDNTAIDYPVVQGQDNAYYLGHLFTGEANRMGSLFVDYRTPGDFSGRMTIIYGHHMNNGSMFASLLKYKEQKYYDAHKQMQVETPSGRYTLELFAGIIADGKEEFLRRDFDDNDDYAAYIHSLAEASTFRSDVTVAADARIVALVTCSYEYTNARYALFGKLVHAAA
ncbi:class B sortase [Paenibacillus rhizovicinus]|uniref:Class B sortase n=1 Tax=Paenibacillus rhizovicinus TaxID=2704463 RepID=A0A6C0P6R9_9BACL|nr:class B sortase [Paenibacillus rhizovicinus]QHW34280.1 class B sortase [Paenibacillus rhizovicinus]